MKVYQFAFHDNVKPIPPDLLKGREPKEYLLSIYNIGVGFGYDSLLPYGIIKLGGYVFNFKEDLKKYIYKSYGEWNEGYAPNKTLLRKNVQGRIEKIIEIK